MTCSDPIDEAVLADYWLGALASAEEEVVEEHLIGCDECGARVRAVIALAEGVRDLARAGSLRLVVSDAFVRRAAEEGLRVRECTPPRGGGVQCTVTAEDDLLIARMAADLSGAKRVDLSLCNERGVEQLRLTPHSRRSRREQRRLPGIDYIRKGDADQHHDRASGHRR